VDEVKELEDATALHAVVTPPDQQRHRDADQCKEKERTILAPGGEGGQRASGQDQEYRDQISQQLVHEQLKRKDSVTQWVQQRPHCQQTLDTPSQDPDLAPELNAVRRRGVLERHGLGLVDHSVSTLDEGKWLHEIADQVLSDLDVLRPT